VSIPRVLIVAGSDSGGGAGIQADIRTVTMLGGHPMTAITAITAQNTLGVQAVHPMPTEIVLAQVDSVLSDLGADAVKVGMIGSAETALALADRLEGAGLPLVFDPVMVATSGATLAGAATVAAFGRLLALATVVTPNLPELAALGGEAAVLAQGCALLVKGGHAEGAAVEDRLVEADGRTTRWSAPRVDTRHTHGTGCTLASGIACALAEGLPLADAVARARLFVRLALLDAPGLGGGHGPMGQGRVRRDGVAAGPLMNQATLFAPDAERWAACGAFYEALGFRRIVDAPPRYARFEGPDGATLSVEVRPGGGGGGPVLYFEHEDPDGAAARLRAAGHAAGEAEDRPWGWREAAVLDPAGNAIRLYRAGEARRYPPWRLP